MQTLPIDCSLCDWAGLLQDYEVFRLQREDEGKSESEGRNYRHSRVFMQILQTDR